MSILDMRGAVVGDVWKIVAIVLLAVILAGGGIGATGWALAASDRDAARADLAAERLASEGLRTSIREQNDAVETMAAAKKLAEEKGAAARQLAAANARRYDDILARHAGATATTCAEAMPVVRDILESVK